MSHKRKNKKRRDNKILGWRPPRRRVCLKVCTVCGNPYPKGKMTPVKYVRHISKFHTAKVYC